MTRPRKPRAKADGLTQDARDAWKKMLKPRDKVGGHWHWVPAGKVAFLRDIAAHRKNAREGMRKYRAARKAAGLLSEDAVKIGRRE